MKQIIALSLRRVLIPIQIIISNLDHPKWVIYSFCKSESSFAGLLWLFIWTFIFYRLIFYKIFLHFHVTADSCSVLALLRCSACHNGWVVLSVTLVRDYKSVSSHSFSLFELYEDRATVNLINVQLTWPKKVNLLKPEK